MSWPYAYTPTIWPMLASGAFMSVIVIYAWSRRSVPGALPLAITMLFAVLWALRDARQALRASTHLSPADKERPAHPLTLTTPFSAGGSEQLPTTPAVPKLYYLPVIYR